MVRPHNLRLPYYEPLVWFMIVYDKIVLFHARDNTGDIFTLSFVLLKESGTITDCM